MVLHEARFRIADGPQHPGLQVRTAIHIVDDPARERVFEQAVHGEIAALRVLLRRGELHAVRMAAIGVAAVFAKSGDLDVMLAALDDHHAKVRAHGMRAWEQLHHVVRRRVRGHIEILGLPAQQSIAHTAARQQSLMAGSHKLLHNIKGGIAGVHGGSGQRGATGGRFKAQDTRSKIQDWKIQDTRLEDWFLDQLLQIPSSGFRLPIPGAIAIVRAA